MIKLDDNLLQDLGLGALPTEEKKKLLAHIYETLEMRVGMELAKQMTDAQLGEFEEFINRNDEAGALRWLETNFPNYKDVVAAEFERLKSEVRQVAPQILASSQQQQAMAPSALPQDPSGYQVPPQQQPYGPPVAPAGYQDPISPAQQPPYPSAPQQPMSPGGPRPSPDDYRLAG